MSGADALAVFLSGACFGLWLAFTVLQQVGQRSTIREGK